MLRIVHTFYIMIAHGQHYLQVEIDTKKDILETMIERFPNILRGEIAHYETLVNEEARAAASGDKEIEIAHKNNSPYNEVIVFHENVLIYHYYSLAIMIYTFAESSLKLICDKYNPIDKKGSGNYLVAYYNQLRKKYDNLPKLRKVWKDRQSFQDMRNKIAHEMKTQNHIATQEYLHKQLNDAHTMLCLVLNQVNKE